jgi:hypothetical protein
MQKIVADKKEAAGAAGGSTAPPALSLKKPSEHKDRDPYAPIASPRRGLEGRETSRREKAAGPGLAASSGRDEASSKRSALKIARPTFLLEAYCGYVQL